MATHRARVAEFLELLSQEQVDIKLLRKCVLSGCPIEKSIRSKCWKILLTYLPTKTAEWPEHLKKQRQVYKNLLDEMIVQPGKKEYEKSRTDVTFEDHPLNPNPDSQWSQYFKDNEMLMQIDKDCRRLLPDLAFFQSATMYPCEELVSAEAGHYNLRKRVEQCVLKSQNVSKTRLGITVTDNTRPRRRSEDYVALPEGQEAHWEVAERILFLYGKLNPGQGYVQVRINNVPALVQIMACRRPGDKPLSEPMMGMNEIIGPIYYTFASDSDEESRENGEADTFWCFTNLMSEIRDNFIKTLDDSDCGIGMLMATLVNQVKRHDTTLWLRLQEQELQPQFYAFRWLTLLLSQEFPLPDVLRLWDSLFADNNRFDFLISVCCAMLFIGNPTVEIRRSYDRLISTMGFPILLSLPNPLKPSVKLRMKMQLEQRRQAMLQLHLSDQQFNSLLKLIRNDLLNGDFPSNMKLLQSYPTTDIALILNKAHELYHR